MTFRPALQHEPRSTPAQELVGSYNEAALALELSEAGRTASDFTRRVAGAKSFVDAVFLVGRRLDALRKVAPGPLLELAAVRFKASFPDIKGVRDSVQHVDERTRGMVHNKPLQTKATRLGDGIDVTAGIGNHVTNSFFGDDFCCTTADGELGRVAITRASVIALQEVLDIAMPELNQASWHPTR